MSTCVELGEERRTDEGPDGNRVHTRKFMVTMDSASQHGPSVYAVSGVPTRFSQHPEDAGALLIHRTATQHADSQVHWTVVCEYNTDLTRATAETPGSGTGAGGAPEEHDDPLQEPPDITFSGQKYQEAMDRDYDGALIRNAAWEMFDPPETVDYAHLVLDVQRNMATFNVNMISTHLYGVNADPWLGFQRDEILLDDIKAKPRWGKGKFYWDVSARFIFYPIEQLTIGGVLHEQGGWFARKLNAGYMKRSGTTVSRIVLPDGSFPSRPQLLDANGGLLAAGGLPLYIKFRKWRRKSLQNLGII